MKNLRYKIKDIPTPTTEYEGTHERTITDNLNSIDATTI